ncbi:MAG: leucyl aminopeptidase [Actinomycetia bacterium]|nr:leucyl aminopeptidase [Actinomycetes bacterium]
MNIVVAQADAEGQGDSIVVPVATGLTWGPGADWVVDEHGPELIRHLRDQRFKGKHAQVATVTAKEGFPFKRIVFIGVGDECRAEGLRQAAATAARAVARDETVFTTLHLVDVPEGSSAECVAFGFLLGQYRFEKYLSRPKPSRTRELTLAYAKDIATAVNRGRIVAEAVAMARDLVNEPAIAKPPAKLADIAVAMGQSAGLNVQVYDRAEIFEAGFGGLAAVAAGSTNPPRMVVMKYEPADATKTLVLVGKGIVFDSGGLSIKSASGMEKMKVDMAGAAAVFAALKAVAELELPVNVTGIAPLTENMPGGNALRPGDVFRARNGKTVEVLNTDAEGRLVLADALSLAAEGNPDLIVDIATLTGAVSVALGPKTAGLFANSDEVAMSLLAAAEKAGESLWRLPLDMSFRRAIRSNIADMKNVGRRQGSPIAAAVFLSEFVDGTPWAHIDMAEPAHTSSRRGYLSKGATGFGVRTLVELAAAFAE